MCCCGREGLLATYNPSSTPLCYTHLLVLALPRKMHLISLELCTISIIQDLCISCRLLVSSSPAHCRTKPLVLLSWLFPQSLTHSLPSILPPCLTKNLMVSVCHVLRTPCLERPQLSSCWTSDVAVTIDHFPSHLTSFEMQLFQVTFQIW